MLNKHYKFGVFFRLYLLYSLLAMEQVNADDLLSIYTLALNHDLEIRLSNTSRLIAFESVKQNRAAYLPQLSFQSSYNQQSITGKSKIENYNPGDDYYYTYNGVSISQTVFNKSLISNSKIVNSNYELAKLQEKNSLLNLTFRVVAAYFEILASADEVKFREEEKFSLYDLLTKTYEKNKAGLSSRIDVNDVQAQYDTAIANHSLALFRQSTAIESLKIITGKSHTIVQPLLPESPIEMPDPADVQHWIKSSHKNNVSLKIARNNLKIAQESITSQQSDRYPKLSLIGTYNKYDDFNRTTGSVIDTTRFTLQLDWSLYQGGAINSRIRQSELIKQQQKITLKQQIFTIERTARDMYFLAISGLTRVQDLYRAVLSHQTALQSNIAGYDVGERSITNLLDAHKKLFQSKREYVQEKYNHILNMTRLRLNAGNLGLTDVKKINSWLKK